jgi:FkbM family methyltransferase
MILAKKFFLRFLRYIGILKHLNLILKTQILHREVFIPSINETGFELYLDLSESWLISILKALNHRSLLDETFVDVGVNLGQTLIKIKSIDPAKDYVGFEPNPFCINYVNRLVEINNYRNTEIFPFAIGNKTCIASLNLFHETIVDSTASLINDFRPDSPVRRTFNVPVFKFSDISFKSAFRIGVLKIDVEGGELEVIESLAEKIKADKPIIIMEILPAYGDENLTRISRQNKIWELLTAIGYCFFRIQKRNNEYHHIQSIAGIKVHADLNMCDYILVHNSKKEILLESLSERQ